MNRLASIYLERTIEQLLKATQTMGSFVTIENKC
jgi:hypothetical protein